MLYSLWDLFWSHFQIQARHPVTRSCGGSVLDFLFFIFEFSFLNFPRRHRGLAARDISILDAMSAHTRVLNKPL